MEKYYRSNGKLKIKDEAERLVELSFSSETPVRRRHGYEVLSHKDGAVSLERIESAGCLLFNHNPDRVIGAIVKAEIKDRRGVATVRFDTDEESEIIFQKVKSGTLRGVSVGYIITKRTQNNRGKIPTYTATQWEPFEISIVSAPADISVGVGRSADDGGADTETAARRIMINKNKYLR